MGVNSKSEVQSKRKCESHESRVCIVGFLACGCKKKNAVTFMCMGRAVVQDVFGILDFQVQG